MVTILAVEVDPASRAFAVEPYEQLAMADLILADLATQSAAFRQQLRRLVLDLQPVGMPHTFWALALRQESCVTTESSKSSLSASVAA